MKFYCEKCAKAFPVKNDGPDKKLFCPECNEECGSFDGELGPGIVINDFLIEKLLSKGGMGEVFLARQISLDRPVALKVLQQKFINDKEYVDSLFREARAAAKLNHPNIVQAYAVGEEDGIFYFAMEFVRGKTFKEILKEEGKVSFGQAAKVIRDIASALDVAWREQKLVHQDIKPDNIMLDANGFAKLADLGLAKSAGSSQEEEDADEVLGTPQYISPEQLTGIPTDVRSDIYSLGATFFHFVTGRFAYVAPTAEEITRMHVAGNLEEPKKFNSELPDELNSVIMKMMARYPEERYQTPKPLIKDLDDFLRKFKESDVVAAPKIKLKNLKINKKAEATADADEAKKSGSAKPAVPAKPVVPAKPAAPAKPVVPAKPAVPAKPVVPAKPAGPAKPVGIVKPVAIPSEKATDDAATAAQDKNSENSETTTSAKSKKLNPKVKIGLIAGVSVIVLLAACAGVLIVLEKNGNCPEALKVISEPLAALIPSAGETQDVNVAAVNTPIVEKEEKPVGPVTREWYVKKCHDLVELYVNNQAEKDKFLKSVDREWLTVITPVTAEEKAAFEELCKTFAGIDEYFRNVAARESLRKSHLDKIAAVVQQREAEEKARLELLAQQKRLREERERLERENEERRRIEIQKEQEAYAALKSTVDGLKDELAYGIIASILKNDSSALNKASSDIAQALQMTVVVTGREKALMQSLARFADEWKPEVEKVTKTKSVLDKIGERHNIMVIFSFGNAIITSCKPGDIRYRDRNDKIQVLNLNQLSGRDKGLFFNALKKRKIVNPEFVIGLYTGKIERNDIPGGFWRNNWNCFEKALKRF